MFIYTWYIYSTWNPAWWRWFLHLQSSILTWQASEKLLVKTFLKTKCSGFWILRSNHRGRYGKGDMAVEAVPWFQLSNDVSIKQFKFIVDCGILFPGLNSNPCQVCQESRDLLCPAWRRCAHQEGIHLHHEAFCPREDCRQTELVRWHFCKDTEPVLKRFASTNFEKLIILLALQVCYWLLSTGFHWKDVQICGTSLARSVLPHVLQR